MLLQFEQHASGSHMPGYASAKLEYNWGCPWYQVQSIMRTEGAMKKKQLSEVNECRNIPT